MSTPVMFRHSLTALLMAMAPLAALTQIVTTTPQYPKDTDSTVVIFDATLGDAGLKDVAPPIYAHTGVITNLSLNSTDWKYVVAPWGTNLPKALMTPLGNNKYKIVFSPSIRSYYGVPSGETILKLAFVFRNSTGSKTGKETGGADIFYDVYEGAMSVNIQQPSSHALYLKQSTPIPVSAISPTAESMKLFLNNTLVKTVAGNTITDTISATGPDWVKQWVRVEAVTTLASAADSFSYTVIPDAAVADLPPGIVDGINYTSETTAVLCLYAPGKDNVFVIGDFNDWAVDSAHYMKVTPDGKRFWRQLTSLVPKQEYIFQYLVDGSIKIGDPYADKVSDPNDQYIAASTYPNLKPYPATKTSGIATYLQTAQDAFAWNTTPFTPPRVTDIVIYELLIRDFIANHDYPSLIDTLDYLKNLGINAISLMPVMEFEGNISWGYNPDYLFAPDKYYGTKNGLKQFVEAAHLHGIAVVLDIVCNHQFGSSPLVKLYWDGPNQRPAANSPWFNVIPKHPFNVGYDFNHESPDTKAYMERLLRYWLTEYHIDGYRFDMSKGFTQRNSYPDNLSLWAQYDAARISILKNYESVVHSVNPNAYMILEHFADNAEEKELAGSNMIIWGNLNSAYYNGAAGWVTGTKSDYSWVSYQYRDWSEPHLVAYMESHDEERTLFYCISAGNTNRPEYNVRDTSIGLKRLELNATFFFTIPGPKMIWQFEELGYDYSINYPSGTSASRLDPKPIRWDYLQDWRRRYVKNIYTALIRLKKEEPAFSTTDYSIDLKSAVKRIWLRDPSMDATVLGNFDVVSKSVVPGFTRPGKWYEYFTGDSLDVADTAAPLPFQAGEYRLYTTKKLVKPAFTGMDDVPSGTGAVLAYPNPSGGRFTFEFNLAGGNEAHLAVYDLYGRCIARQRYSDLVPGVRSVTLDLSGKAGSGLYFFSLDAGNLHETGKLVVK